MILILQVNLDENADFNQIFGPGSSATNINCAEAGSCLWILEQTEDGQTVLIPASGANAPSIVSYDVKFLLSRFISFLGSLLAT